MPFVSCPMPGGAVPVPGRAGEAERGAEKEMKNSLKYAQCYDYLVNYIKKNNYRKDDRLPTGKEIAETLGVSRITVQRALTELQEAGIIYRVQGSGTFLAKEIGQEESGGVKIIPMVVSHDGVSTRSFEMIQGAEAYFSEQNCYLTVHNSYGSTEQEVEIVERLLADSFRSLLVFPVSSMKNRSYYYRLIRDGVNIVFLDHAPNDINCNLVESDNVSGGYQATEHLIGQGHRRIGVVCPDDMRDYSSFSERYAGYRFALKQHGIEKKEEYVAVCRDSGEIPGAVEKLLGEKERPTAVFVFNGLAAVEVANEVRRQGYRVPEDVAVIGFDNLEELCLGQPVPLSSVDQDFYRIGYTAAKLLHEIMRENDGILRDCKVPVKLVARASTGGGQDAPAELGEAGEKSAAERLEEPEAASRPEPEAD